MSKFIYVGKEKVSVTDEVYKEYYRMKRREKYLEKDIKQGRMVIDPDAETVEYIPSKEDSINRLMDKGTEFKNDQMIEEILCDKATLLILQEAFAELNREEQELIEGLYYKNLTTREIGKEIGVSHMAVVKRHKKILDKMKKFF